MIIWLGKSKEDNRSNLMKIAFKLMQIVGMNPEVSSRTQKIILCNVLVISFIMETLICINMLLKDIHDARALMDLVNAFVLINQAVARYVTVWSGNRIFLELSEDRKNYYKLDELKGAVRKKMNDVLKLNDYVAKAICFHTTTVFIVIMIKAFFTREMPLECWIPNRIPHIKVVILILQVVYMGSTLGLVVGSDILYLDSAVHLIVQFEILKLKFHNIHYYDGEELKECIKHHAFLLRLRF